jgi:hypothetical protein
METQTVFPTTPLLRPDQVKNAQDEIKSLEAKLVNPLIEDKGMVRKQLTQAKKLTEAQTPRSPETAEEEGRMVSRSRQLLDEILQGMPSQEEMRKAPPGAVDKHMKWEKRNKPKILEWKNLQLRLKPGEREAASLEQHRPTGSSLNMDNAFIPGKNFFMPATNGPAVTFNDAQIAALRQVSPQLADALALLSNQDRQQIKDTISGIGLSEETPVVKKNKGGRPKQAAQAVA